MLILPFSIPEVQISTINILVLKSGALKFTGHNFHCPVSSHECEWSFFGVVSDPQLGMELEGIFMRMFSHWGSLVPDSCIYFKSKSF